MRSSIRKRVTRSGLLWIALAAVAAALACAGSSDLDEEGGGSGSGRSGSMYGQEVGGSDFERYGGSMGSELSQSERDALGLQSVYFDFDQFSLNDGGRATLRRNAEILSGHPDILVEVQGNCDERGSEEYNLALGERRAQSVKDYLVNSGISRGRISAVSFGEANPEAVGQGERSWQMNRRADLVPKR